MGLNKPVGGPVMVLVAEYDFAKDGGAIGTITMRSVGQLGAVVPAGAIIKSGMIQVLTGFTGAGSLALQAEGAADLVASTAVAGAPYSTTGTKVIIPQGAATAIVTTVDRALKAVIAGGTITAGKLRLYVDYI